MTDFKSTQAERRALAGSTATTTKDATTLHQLANLDTSLKGDFSTGGYVSGSERGVNYPAASGPWSGPQVPPEPPRGMDVNAIEPVGEAHEIAAAALILEARAAGGAAPQCSGEAAPPTLQRKEDE